MELQNEVLTQKPLVIIDSTTPNRSPLLQQEPVVNRTRKIILILVSILIVLCLVNSIFILHSYITSDLLEGQSPNTSSQLVTVLISIIYYSFGLLITYRYYQRGILIFAWLGFVSLLLLLAVVIVNLIDSIVTTSYLGFGKRIVIATIFMIIFLTALLLQIFTVRYTFILSKLLKTSKYITIEQT